MVKKLSILLLVPWFVSASDNFVTTQDESSGKGAFFDAVKDQLDRWDSIERGCSKIAPKDFNDYGKQVLGMYVGLWANTIKKDNFPTDTGLGKIFWDMEQDGVEKLINDWDALKKANEYYDDYEKSPSATIEANIKQQLKPGPGGNYCFPGAAESNVDRIRITRQHEFYNILYKRHEAPIMPVSGLVGWYYDLSEKSAKQSLELNKNNTSLSSKAIRGLTLLSAYMLQQDQL